VCPLQSALPAFPGEAISPPGSGLFVLQEDESGEARGTARQAQIITGAEQDGCQAARKTCLGLEGGASTGTLDKGGRKMTLKWGWPAGQGSYRGDESGGEERRGLTFRFAQ
jgi:hypothetical protein